MEPEASAPTGLTATARIEVTAAADAIFRWISDLPRMATFSPECERCEWLEGGPGVIGSRFRGFNRLGPFRWWTQGWVVKVDSPRTFIFETSTAFEPRNYPVTRWAYTIEEIPGATLLSERVTILKLVRLARRFPFLARFRVRHLRRGMASTLRKLKAAVEAESKESATDDNRA